MIELCKRLFSLLFRLIVEPDKTWSELSEKRVENKEDFYKNYLYPVLLIIAALSFMGASFSVEKFDLQNVLKTIIKQVTVYGGGFYITSFVLSEFIMPRFQESCGKLLSDRFTGYASALIYAVAMIQSIFPSLFFLRIIVFYSAYMIWSGAIHYLQIAEKDWVKFTVLAGLAILFIPMLINLFLDFLFPGM
jgi:hypothetical protein